VAITGVACQAVQVWLITAPAMSVSREYQGRKSATRSSTPHPAGTSCAACGRVRSTVRVWALDSMAATLGRQAAATAAPAGSSKPVAASSRMLSMASVAGER
jgi:hypothetical protein